MISVQVADEVKRLVLETGLSYRKAAAMVGISRGTAKKMVKGEWSPIRKGLKEPDEGHPAVDGPRVRCPGCGGMVWMPCWLCFVRAITARHRKSIRPSNETQAEEPSLEVLRKRTSEIRERRREDELGRKRISKFRRLPEEE